MRKLSTSDGLSNNVNGKDIAVSKVLARIRSDLLAAEAEDISVDRMLKHLGVRGFGFLLFMLALLNIVIFFVPGVSFLFGIPLVVFSVQMLIGIRRPFLPRFLRHKTIKVETLVRGLDVGEAALLRLEPYIRPRVGVLMLGQAEKIHHILALAMSVLVALPVPLLNIPPSLALVFLALGIMQRDGVCIAFAYILGGWTLWLYGSLNHLAQSVF